MRQYDPLDISVDQIKKEWEDYEYDNKPEGSMSLEANEASIAQCLEHALNKAESSEDDFYIPSEANQRPGISVTNVCKAIGISRVIASAALNRLVEQGYLVERNKRSYQAVSRIPTLPPPTMGMTTSVSVNGRLRGQPGYNGGDILSSLMPYNESAHGDLKQHSLDYLEGFIQTNHSMDAIRNDMISKAIRDLEEHDKQGHLYVMTRLRYCNKKKRGGGTIWWLEEMLLRLDEAAYEGFARALNSTLIATGKKPLRLHLSECFHRAHYRKVKSLASTVTVQKATQSALGPTLTNALKESGMETQNTHHLAITSAHFNCPQGIIAITRTFENPEVATIRTMDFSVDFEVPNELLKKSASGRLTASA